MNLEKKSSINVIRLSHQTHKKNSSEHNNSLLADITHEQMK